MDRPADPRPLVALRIQPRLQHQSCQRQEHRHKHVHVRRQVQQAMPKGRQKPQRRQIGLRVVLKNSGFPKTNPVFAKCQPYHASQRQTHAREPGRLAPAPSANRRRTRETPPPPQSPQASAESTIAVSLHSAAAVNHTAATRGLRSRSGSAYTSPQSVHAAAKISACASVLCANQTRIEPRENHGPESHLP